MPTSTPAPGWFPDQTNSEQLRWWDGQAWTDQTKPLSLIDPIPLTPWDRTTRPLSLGRPSQRRRSPGTSAGGRSAPLRPQSI
ncbi:MAG: DUF2510 domain-containing protein [Nocardioides sp.]|nr:DUF2510 domain-containing protein [Nocardioides sp.]